MKSIKQQYIDLKEGRMSQQNFMRNLRMTMPQYVTNVTSYNDAVKILRNKGILNETLIKQLEKGIEVEKEHTKDEVKAAKIALDHLKEDPKYYTKLDKAGLEESHEGNTQWMETLIDILGAKGIDLPEDFDLGEYEGMTPQQAAAELIMIQQAEEEESGKYTTGMDQFELREAKSWTSTSGKELYAQFKEIDNLNGQEVLIGIDFEMQENPELSKTDAAKIVIKNLKKNPIYYTSRFMAGKEMKEIPTIGKLKPGSDQMKPVKGEDSLVDKDNGMKPVKDVEKPKKDSDKEGEKNKAVAGISLMSLVAKASKGVAKMNATGEKMKVVKENVEMHGGFKVGDKVMVNPDSPEATDATRLEKGKIYTITNFRIYKRGSLLQNVDALLDNDEEINVDYLVKASSSVPSTIFSKNADLSQKVQKLSKDDLMEMIREELAELLSNQQETDEIAATIDETFDGRDNLTDVTGENK